MPGELDRGQALRLAAEIVAQAVPYVMLCGGEPTIVPHFWDVAEALGRGGVWLKIETNGQTMDEEGVARLSRLPVRSVQVSLDGASQKTYGRMRPGGSFEAAVSTCRLLREAGLPLEITFAPTRLNIGEATAVIDLALELGAFRFNTGRLMRIGTAAGLWDRLEPSEEEYSEFLAMLSAREAELAGLLELAFRPFQLGDQAREALAQPPATLLILPDGRVKVSAALPVVCADLKTMGLAEAWKRYLAAWDDPRVRRDVSRAADVSELLAGANRLSVLEDLPAVV